MEHQLSALVPGCVVWMVCVCRKARVQLWKVMRVPSLRAKATEMAWMSGCCELRARISGSRIDGETLGDHSCSPTAGPSFQHPMPCHLLNPNPSLFQHREMSFYLFVSEELLLLWLTYQLHLARVPFPAWLVSLQGFVCSSSLPLCPSHRVGG